MIRQENNSWLDLQDSIVPTIGIACSLRCHGIITPLAVDDETIFIRTGLKFDVQYPLSVADQFQRRGITAPIIEGASDQDAPCPGLPKAQRNLALSRFEPKLIALRD